MLCLSDNTSAELVQGEGQMGIVVSVASDTNPLFVVKLEGLREGEMKNFPRAQLRTAHNDSSDQFRQETGYVDLYVHTRARAHTRTSHTHTNTDRDCCFVYLPFLVCTLIDGGVGN